jgi:hypothetical protein
MNINLIILMGMLLVFEEGHTILTDVDEGTSLKVANDMKQYELTLVAMFGHVH